MYRTIDSRLLIWIHFLTSPVLVAVLYWPVLELPFFWDDVANFEFMQGRSLLSFWTSASGFPYYRPLGFSIFRIWQWLFGATNTFAFHLLNIIVMICNGWLIAAIGLKVWLTFDNGSKPNKRSISKSIAGNIFAWQAAIVLCSFPFASIVIPLVASLFHLLVTMLVLLSVLAILNFYTSGDVIWAYISALCACLAPFAHESGIIAGYVLAALWTVVLRNVGKQNKIDSSEITISAKLFISISVVANTAFPLLWTFIDKMRLDTGLPTLRPMLEIWNNTIFFFAAYTFPVQPFAFFLSNQTSWSEPQSVVIVGSLCLVIIALIFWRFHKLRLLLLSVIFVVLMSLPSILTLPQLYVVVSPRLTVLPSISAALMWSGLFTLIAIRSKYHSWLAVLLSVTLLTIPIRYINSRVELHRRALAPISDMVSVVELFPEDTHLVVNPTTWLASAHHTYPIVHDGVVVIPEYHDPGQLVGVHTNQVAQVDGINFPLVAVEPDHHYYDVWGEVLHWDEMAARIRKYDHVWLTTYGDGPLGFTEVGQVLYQEFSTIDQIPLAIFDRGRLILFSGLLTLDMRGELLVELVWKLNSPSTEEVFVHTFDCQGNLLGMADGPPLGRMFPFWQWVNDETVRDVRNIRLSDSSSLDCVMVEVGLFEPSTGNRVVVHDSDGNEYLNGVVSLGINLDNEK
jgi:hypothetical protein